MIDVYVAVLPKSEAGAPLSCSERQKEIDALRNERVRREKYYVWRLLEYAIKNSLGADASRLCFTKGKNERWSCEGFEFSLSHSGSALAVAISDKAVGVDVERIRVRRAERMAEYILTSRELCEYEILSDEEKEEWLIHKWCEKEAIFKSWDKEFFSPSKIETADFFCVSRSFELSGERYILSVAADSCDEIRIFDDVKLF